jgi:hypothetical protein
MARYLWLSYSVSVRMSTNQIRLQLQNQAQVSTVLQFCKSSNATLLAVTRSHCSTGTVPKAVIYLNLLLRNFRKFWAV